MQPARARSIGPRSCMAARKLAKLGAEALKPKLVDGTWHKPAISTRIAARLRKQYFLDGREWPLVEEAKPQTKFGFGLRRTPKGHKFEKQQAERRKDIENNLKDMPRIVAEYREQRKLKDTSLLDKLLMTPKERRMKQYRASQ